MKRTINTLALSVFALAGTALAEVQTTARINLEAPIMVGRETLPAGEYTLERSVTNGGHHYIAFRSAKKSVLATVNAFPEQQVDPLASGVTLVTEPDGQHVRKVILGGYSYQFHQ